MKTRVANLFKEYFGDRNIDLALQEEIVELCKQVQRETWKEASKQVSECKEHHYKNELGDPHGCLDGLAAEFYNKANDE